MPAVNISKLTDLAHIYRSLAYNFNMSIFQLQRAHVLTQPRAKSLSRTMTRPFLSIRRSSSHREPLELPPAGHSLLRKEPIDEERCPGYSPKKVLPCETCRGTRQSLSERRLLCQSSYRRDDSPTWTFAPELVARSNAMLRQNWHDLMRIEDGSIFESSEQYFGGPLFDQDGIRSTLYRTELRVC